MLLHIDSFAVFSRWDNLDWNARKVLNLPKQQLLISQCLLCLPVSNFGHSSASVGSFVWITSGSILLTSAKFDFLSTFLAFESRMYHIMRTQQSYQCVKAFSRRKKLFYDNLSWFWSKTVQQSTITVSCANLTEEKLNFRRKSGLRRESTVVQALGKHFSSHWEVRLATDAFLWYFKLALK